MRVTERSDTYLVMEDFGARLGCAWRETDAAATDRETLIPNLMDGQYGHPLRIVAFNTAEGLSRDVTKDIADELPSWNTTRSPVVFCARSASDRAGRCRCAQAGRTPAVPPRCCGCVVP